MNFCEAIRRSNNQVRNYYVLVSLHFIYVTVSNLSILLRTDGRQGPINVPTQSSEATMEKFGCWVLTSEALETTTTQTDPVSLEDLILQAKESCTQWAQAPAGLLEKLAKHHKAVDDIASGQHRRLFEANINNGSNSDNRPTSSTTVAEQYSMVVSLDGGIPRFSSHATNNSDDLRIALAYTLTPPDVHVGESTQQHSEENLVFLLHQVLALFSFKNPLTKEEKTFLTNLCLDYVFDSATFGAVDKTFEMPTVTDWPERCTKIIAAGMTFRDLWDQYYRLSRESVSLTNEMERLIPRMIFSQGTGRELAELEERKEATDKELHDVLTAIKEALREKETHKLKTVDDVA